LDDLSGKSEYNIERLLKEISEKPKRRERPEEGPLGFPLQKERKVLS
jgi:hypothetical protein